MSTITRAFQPKREPIASIPGRRTIGAILVDNERMSAADAEAVLRAQKKDGRKFGDVAIELGLLSAEDVRFALSHQFEYPSLGALDRSLSPDLVAAYEPFSRTVEQLRALRSQLMLRWFSVEVDRKPLAIVAPDARSGASFIAANLAIVFSQLGERTLLIDANLRQPQQQGLFRIAGVGGLSDVLTSRTNVDEATIRIPSLIGLSVLPAGHCPPNPQELLGRPVFAEMLARVAYNYDVVLIDTAPITDFADAQVVAARAGGAIIVARRDVTPLQQLKQAGLQVQQTGALLLGTVMNDGF